MLEKGERYTAVSVRKAATFLKHLVLVTPADHLAPLKVLALIHPRLEPPRVHDHTRPLLRTSTHGACHTRTEQRATLDGAWRCIGIRLNIFLTPVGAGNVHIDHVHGDKILNF